MRLHLEVGLPIETGAQGAVAIGQFHTSTQRPRGIVEGRQQRTDTLSLSSTAGSRFTKHVVFELFVPRPSAVERDGTAVPFVADLDAVNLGATWTNGLLQVKAPLGATLVVR